MRRRALPWVALVKSILRCRFDRFLVDALHNALRHQGGPASLSNERQQANQNRGSCHQWGHSGNQRGQQACIGLLMVTSGGQQYRQKVRGCLPKGCCSGRWRGGCVPAAWHRPPPWTCHTRGHQSAASWTGLSQTQEQHGGGTAHSEGPRGSLGRTAGSLTRGSAGCSAPFRGRTPPPRLQARPAGSRSRPLSRRGGERPSRRQAGAGKPLLGLRGALSGGVGGELTRIGGLGRPVDDARLEVHDNSLRCRGHVGTCRPEGNTETR
jgi:hypothetical protein